MQGGLPGPAQPRVPHAVGTGRGCAARLGVTAASGPSSAEARALPAGGTLTSGSERQARARGDAKHVRLRQPRVSI